MITADTARSMPRAHVFRNRTPRLSVRLLLVVAMLFAQLGAQDHVYSHILSALNPDAAMGATTQVCADCLAFGPLLSAAHSSAKSWDFRVCAASAPIAVSAWSLLNSLPLFAFRSRAPPALV